MLDAIASKEPAPASGSAAAAVVAAAAALLEKVARLSVKRWSGAPGALEQAHALRLRSEELVQEDLQSYLTYIEARRSGEDLDAALARTIEVPLAVVSAASQVVDLAQQLAERGNPNLLGDAVVAAILASAAAEAGVTLIAINLGPATSDIRLAEAQMLARGASERARSLRPADS